MPLARSRRASAAFSRASASVTALSAPRTCLALPAVDLIREGPALCALGGDARIEVAAVGAAAGLFRRLGENLTVGTSLASARKTRQARKPGFKVVAGEAPWAAVRATGQFD